ncbi:MAG: SPW repeat domain-containing protein [Thermodesulfobacteriota bacterium]
MSKLWQAWAIGILGIWLFIAAFLSFPAMGNLWNNLIVGIITAIAGFTIIKQKIWQGWTAGILGIWLVIAAFIPVLQTYMGNMWNGIIVGILLMIAGFGAFERKGHEIPHAA